MLRNNSWILALGGLGLLLIVVGLALTFWPQQAASSTLVAASAAAANTPEADLVSAQIDLPSPTLQPTTPAEPTVVPSVVATSTAVPATAAPTPSPIPSGPTDVNGIPISTIVVMPDAVRAHVGEIYAAGQALGRDPHAFSKLGDSTLLNPHFLGPFDEDNYNLGDFASLQATIDQFPGSFARHGVATRHGLHSWSVFDPLWADKDWCLPNEHVLACEFRLNNPSVLFVRLGSNDAGAPAGFRKFVRDVVEFSLENGVIPILGTKADRFEGDNTNNDIIREVAAEWNVPLWEFDLVAETIPGRGLDGDQVHLIQTTDPHDYTDPAAFQRGHAMQDLTALLVLDAVRQEMR